MSGEANAELRICLVTTSSVLAGKINEGIAAIECLRVISALDATTDLAAALRGDPPDVIVFDHGTCAPVLEDLMRTISRLAQRPHVVVLTARTNISEREALLFSGVDFVFTKLRPMTDLGPVLRRLGPAGSVSQHLQARATGSGMWFRGLASPKT
jgi:DNA-binding NarL/FixJ family response regulator